MEQKNKPLSEWTLAECKQYCKDKCEQAKADNEYCDRECLPNMAGICGKNPEVWDVQTGEKENSQPNKPRLAKVLGVEVGEWFRVKGFGGEHCIQPTGAFYCKGEEARSNALLFAINHPESIIHAPRLTEKELERCGMYGAKYLTRDSDDIMVYLYCSDPRDPNCPSANYIGQIKSRFFPSVQPGDCICVEEAGGDA